MSRFVSLDPELEEDLDLEDELAGVCRVCGCSDEEPCEGGCIWAEADLCSRCARGRR